MNSYYSNLIEGNNTSPWEIQKALRQDFSKEPAKRALQQESVAHIDAQKQMERRLHEEPDLEICSSDFIVWIHKIFYNCVRPVNYV